MFRTGMSLLLVLAAAAVSAGIDGHDETHNSNIDNPNNPAFFVRSFDDASRPAGHAACSRSA